MSEPTVEEMLLKQWLIEDATSEETARTLFKQEFLVNAVDSLFHARHAAEITPEQMAEKLGITKAKLLRLEGDTTGSMTLHRYADLALAYGMAPKLTLVPLEQARQEVIESLHKEGAK